MATKVKTKKRFKIYNTRQVIPLISQRATLVGDHVGAAIKTFLGETGKHVRHCVTCGYSFEPKHRFHFTCVSDCYKQWTRGQFRPRT